VHAFGEDRKLARIFMVFMGVLLVTGFGFLIKRLPELRSRAKLDSPLSREAAFLVNNWIRLFAAFFVLFATMFPTLSEAVRGERLNIGPPFFNKFMVPIGLVLLFLTGVGPLIAWRKADFGHLRYQFAMPAAAAVVAAAVCLAVGLGTSWAPIVCFALCAFTATTITQELARGASIRRRNTGSDFMTALVGMIIRGRRRYGGYVVHVGIVLMFLGFAGQAYQREDEVQLRPGQQHDFGRYVLRYDRLLHEEDRQKEMVTAEFTVLQGGKEIGKMRPARWFFHKNPQSTTEVAIRRSPAEDLYITLGTYDFSENAAHVKIVLNPLVNWIWLGFMLLAFGTGIALLPESVLAPVTARVGAAEGVAAAGRTAALLLAAGALLATLLGGARPAFAARDPAAVAADRKWLRENIMCMCGCRSNVAECPMPKCSHADPDTDLVDKMLAEGKSRDDVVAAFVKQYGGAHVLMAPPDKGFNRLAWALPYTVGAAGVAGLAFAAWRFTRRGESPGKAPAAPEPAAPRSSPAAAEPDLEEKLEDELAKID
jgi:cytochrome c-type biogenesis protein CcmF